MSSLQQTLVHWVDQRVGEMLAAPRMWGSREAVELQTILLMELRALVLRPSLDAENPRWLLDQYTDFLSTRYPNVPMAPLFEHAAEMRADEATFVSVLEAFRAAVSKLVVEENPFEHSDLALVFRFSEGRNPSITACTSYYEDFRRALRAVIATPDSAGRRPKKSIEQATDFGWEDARISQKNGSPGFVALRLATPLGQLDFEAQERVRAGLSHVVTLAEWAATNEEVGALAIDDALVRTHTALQTRRLLPRRGITSVELGGRIVGRSKPVRLDAGLEQRMMHVVAAQSSAESFDRSDEVRAIDLDRGTIRLGSRPGVLCYAAPEQLENVNRVGVMATVVGQQFKSLLGKAPFVLASTITLSDAADEA